ncbi:MAG TPA: DEAD/DEAH box helicase, partial [Spirochaetota bacterium]|nr:DEAD/DEAH box helicase [Spirochaetota bacterium]
MKKIFDTEGLLKDAISSYEFREEQLIMAEFIASRLIETGNAIIEAGTGIGKTMAYLIPVILHAVEHNKRIAISTETKALQKQLIDKDIPIAKKVLNDCGIDFSFSICLGSANYPCRRRFEIAKSLGSFKKKDIPAVENFQERFRKGVPFSRFDIRVDNTFWNSISREPDSCGSFNCPYFNTCLFQKAKREWSQSQVLVMNHYLFFTNIASSKTYLPQCDIVIFDEAHSLESIGCAQLGFRETYNTLIDTISRFGRRSRKKHLLSAIKDNAVMNRAVSLLRDIESECSRFFESLRSLCAGKQHYRYGETLGIGERLVLLLRDFITPLNAVIDDIEHESDRIEFEIALGKLFTAYKNIESGVYLHREEFVYWIEGSGKDMFGDIGLYGKPVDISETMEAEVNSFYDTVLYISATLSIKGSFDYIIKQLGIQNFSTQLLKSPFDYRNQVTLLLEKENILPDSSEYISRIARTSSEIIIRMSGNCLILFTSYAMLQRVKEELSNLIEFPIFAQGDYNAADVIDNYCETDGS